MSLIIRSHVRAFEYFQGVPELVIQDNLKSGVTIPCRYEPELNATYQEMLAHYGTAGLPTRVRHPNLEAMAATAGSYPAWLEPIS